MNHPKIIELRQGESSVIPVQQWADRPSMRADRIKRITRPFERDLAAAFKLLSPEEREESFQLILCLPLTETEKDELGWTPPYSQSRFDAAKGSLLLATTPSIWLRWERQNPLHLPNSPPEREYELLIQSAFANLFRMYEDILAEVDEEKTRVIGLSQHLRLQIRHAVKAILADLDRKAADLRAEEAAIARRRMELLQFVNPYD